MRAPAALPRNSESRVHEVLSWLEYHPERLGGADEPRGCRMTAAAPVARRVCIRRNRLTLYFGLFT